MGSTPGSPDEETLKFHENIVQIVSRAFFIWSCVYFVWSMFTTIIKRKKTGLITKLNLVLIAALFLFNTYHIWFNNPNSEEDVTNDLVEVFTDGLKRDYQIGHTKRDGHPKTVGTVTAEFKINSDLKPEYRIGVFKEPGKVYKALIRLSNGGFGKEKPDYAPGIKGFAIKLLDDQGKSLNQDFILISKVRTSLSQAFLVRDGVYSGFKKTVPQFVITTVITGYFMDVFYELTNWFYGVFSSLLDIPFFSNTPYAFGDSQVKYHVNPTSKRKSPAPDHNDPDYLTKRLQDHLKAEDGTFDFFIQNRTERDIQPIDALAPIWYSSDSPFIHVATIRIPKQDFTKNAELSEELSFSPGHAWNEHRPLGAMNRVRLGVYKRMQEFRHSRDGRQNFA